MREVRRKRHENELHEKYMQLYHNEQCYEELMQSLEEAYQNRPAELRRLDNKREKEPNWYRNRNMLGITMYPKLFAGGPYIPVRLSWLVSPTHVYLLYDS